MAGSSASSGRLRATIMAMVALAAVALLAVSGCGGGDSEEPASSAASNGLAPTSEDPGPVHVHGLGVDPADEALFIASHTGLFKLPKGSEAAERVADRYQDTMAFTIVGPNRFLGSGHPDGREDLPPFLGLIESKDAGGNWEEISLMGEVDFHLLAAADERVYGFGSEWEGEEALFLVSTDGGETWAEGAVPGPLIGLALSPGDPRTLVASTTTGLYRSRNGGDNWQSVPGPAGFITWPKGDQLYLVGANGEVEVSADEGKGWRPVGELPEEPAAFGSGADRLLAATHSGKILESTDGGSTWDVRLSP